MISNDRQYRAAQRQRDLLAQAFDDLVASEGGSLVDTVTTETPADDRDTFVKQLAWSSIAGQMADLETELHEYEALRAGEVTSSRVSSLGEVPEALIRARIAAGLSQRQLAERLGLKEQQIQRYEAERYAGASLARLREVVDALGVELDAGLSLAPPAFATKLRRRLIDLGFDRRVVDNRLLRDLRGDSGDGKVVAIAERIGRLLGMPAELLLSASAPPALATTARFQAPRNASAAGVDAYTRYAEGLADIVLRATPTVGATQPAGSARNVREDLDRAVAGLDVARTVSERLLLATLDYATSIGVVVVGLRDPGAFHGACFTRDGRAAVVVKHTSDSAARWLAVLLHELDHVRDVDEVTIRSWIELGEIETWSDTPEERRANAFAADVLFSGRADAVMGYALQRAQGSIARLKAVVPDVADEADVPVDVLANYLAFRLGQRGINWWPTATRLQQPSDPWRLVADHLLTHLDFTLLDSVDRQALFDALAP